MIKGKPREFKDFPIHPEGRFDGILYAWKCLGEKTNQYGNTNTVIMERIESLTEKIPSGEYKGNPFTVGIFYNLVWGNPKRRTGNFMPKMQKMREVILDRRLTEDEWYQFDPYKNMGLRVRYRVWHDPKSDGSNDVWVNSEVTERLDDQTIGEQFNETEVVEPEESSQAFIAGEMDQAQISGSPSTSVKKPDLPGPPEPDIHPKKKEYACKLVNLMASNGLYTENQAVNALMWIDTNDLTRNEFEGWWPPFEAAVIEASKEKGFTIPEAEIHPMSKGEDSLPI